MCKAMEDLRDQAFQEGVREGVREGEEIEKKSDCASNAESWQIYLGGNCIYKRTFLKRSKKAASHAGRISSPELSQSGNPSNRFPLFFRFRRSRKAFAFPLRPVFKAGTPAVSSALGTLVYFPR